MWPHWSDVKCTFLLFPNSCFSLDPPASDKGEKKIKRCQTLVCFQFLPLPSTAMTPWSSFSEKFHLYCDLKYIVVEFIWLYLIIIVWITFLNYLGTQHKSPHCILDQSLWIIFAFLTSIFIPLPVPLHLVYLIHHLTILISIITIIKWKPSGVFPGRHHHALLLTVGKLNFLSSS